MIRLAESADLPALAALGAQLWPEHTPAELETEFAGEMAAGVQFLLLSDHTVPAGFAQCSLRRDYVEGTRSSPVGYLEGIFVLPAYRGKGHAGRLLAAAEAWARAQGCTEFASDCEWDNIVSRDFHLHNGFTEANRIICFTKML